MTTRGAGIVAGMENLSGRTLFVAAVDAEAAHIPDGEALLITGIGTVPAAISLTEVLAEARAHDALPERVVNIGTAGALVDGMDGVFEINKVTKHDFKLDVLTDISRYLLPEFIELETSGELPARGLATGDMFVSTTALRNELVKNPSYAIWRAIPSRPPASASACPARCSSRFLIPRTRNRWAPGLVS